eukprot:CAMPEP_0116852772 /NCGR_PEP_ID=MMETSP0418-20121206/17504_1 /TAXON_ID=1158023 /ORGANISM="Astrosyne radiata, Strain 13vi08-1A" /LENGTH=139 /DNA_ID=CAMNT_0004485023 /DNA_START=36 /DNA_END=451 /DNA_ORIENTATION=+
MSSSTPSDPRSVRFSTMDPLVASIPQWYIDVEGDKGRRQTWWSASEYATIRDSAACVADTIASNCDSIPTPRNRRSYVRAMKMAELVSRREEDLKEDDLKTSLSSSSSSSKWYEDVAFWTKVGHERRGLEHMTAYSCHR